MKKEKRFRIHGVVRRRGKKKGIPDLRVQALDKDLFFDDRLGSATTDGDGRFEIRYAESDFKDFFESRPDIYLRISDAAGSVLFTTEDKVRYEAQDTEKFIVELPAAAELIGDTSSLIRHLLGNKALLAELSETVAGALQEKCLLAADLSFTLVPLVCDRPDSVADLFVVAQGPHPEPSHSQTFTGRLGRSSNATSPVPHAGGIMPPWWWWWIGLPPMEFLQWLEQQRLSDVPVAEQTGLPTRETADFARRIMADKALVTLLSNRIERLFSKHGMAMEAGKTYVFAPVVYQRPVFAGEAFVPQLIDSAADTASGIGGWVNPIDGVMPPYLHQSVHPEV
jgi:hypothetical protein